LISDKKQPENVNKIKIFARCRPMQIWEEGNECLELVHDKNVVLCKSNGYAFQKIFGQRADNESLFADVCEPLVQKVLSGVDAMLVAYGTTGSGKTYSFVGDYESEPQVLGLMPQTLQRLLELRPEMEMRLSVAEAYSDNSKAITLYDLLKPRKNGNQLRRSNFLKSITKKTITSTEDVLTHIQYAFKQAHIFPTQKNPRSSRGHTIYMAEIKFDGESNYFMFCDLAGAEGHTAVSAEWANANGIPQRVLTTRQLEAGCINIGLTEFALFLEELAGKRKIQKRKGDGLRFLMSETLGPKVLHTQVAVLFTLSPSSTNESSTKKTLEQAVHFGTFKFGNLKKKAGKRELVAELRKQIELLTDQLEESNEMRERLEEILRENGIEPDGSSTKVSIGKMQKMLSFGGNTLTPAVAALDELSDLISEDSDDDFARFLSFESPKHVIGGSIDALRRSMTMDDLLDVQVEIEDVIVQYQEQHNAILDKLLGLRIGDNDVEDYAMRLEGLCTKREIENFLKSDQIPPELAKKLKLPNRRKSQGYGMMKGERKERGTVYVYVLNAKNLPNARKLGVSNPYCKVKVNGKRIGKTQVVKANLNPEWDSCFSFDIDGISDVVEISVWDHSNYGRQKEMGIAQMTVQEIIDGVREFYKTILPSPLSKGGVMNVMFDYHESYEQSSTLLDLYDNVVDNLVGSGKCKCGKQLEPHMKYCFNCGTKRTYLMHLYAFKQLLYSVQIEVTTEKLNELFAVMDADDNGYIQFWEFQAFLGRNSNEEYRERDREYSKEDLRDSFLRALNIPTIISFGTMGDFILQQEFVSHRPQYVNMDANGSGEERYMYFHPRNLWIITESRFQITEYEPPNIAMQSTCKGSYIPPRKGWVKKLDDGEDLPFDWKITFCYEELPEELKTPAPPIITSNDSVSEREIQKEKSKDLLIIDEDNNGFLGSNDTVVIDSPNAAYSPSTAYSPSADLSKLYGDTPRGKPAGVILKSGSSNHI